MILRLILKDPLRSALVATAAVASTAIPLSYLIFLVFLKNKVVSLIFAMLFGFSSSVWLFCSIPETFSLNLAMIVMAFFLQSFKIPPDGLSWKRFKIVYIIYSIIAVGISLPNIIYATLAFVNICRKRGEGKRWSTMQTSYYLSIITLLLMLLSSLQVLVYHGAYLFWNPISFIRVFMIDHEYFMLDPSRLANAERILKFARYFLIDNITAPIVISKEWSTYHTQWTMLGFTTKKAYLYFASALFYFFWLSVASLSTPIKKIIKDYDVQLACCFIAFNIVFHQIYYHIGYDCGPFLYSIHTSFCMIYLLARAYHVCKIRFKKILLTLYFS